MALGGHALRSCAGGGSVKAARLYKASRVRGSYHFFRSFFSAGAAVLQGSSDGGELRGRGRGAATVAALSAGAPTAPWGARPRVLITSLVRDVMYEMSLAGCVISSSVMTPRADDISN